MVCSGVAIGSSCCGAKKVLLTAGTFHPTIFRVFAAPAQWRALTTAVLECAQTQTVPYLIDNPEVGYVQTRWVFVNPDESYLTKVWAAYNAALLGNCNPISPVSSPYLRWQGLGAVVPSEAPPYLALDCYWEIVIRYLKAVSCSAQAQEISLNFHCKCEQFVHFATGSFFNFNGTAGA